MGYVYLILMMDESEKLYKIGFTKNDPNKRLKQLQTGAPHELRLINSYKTEHYKKVERMLHGTFFKENVKNEWFHLEDDKLKTFIPECKKADKTIRFLIESGNPFI
jgi:hypothetical protein